jgi:hypothetical protein
MGIGVFGFAAEGAASADCGRVADLKFGHYSGCASISREEGPT